MLKPQIESNYKKNRKHQKKQQQLVGHETVNPRSPLHFLSGFNTQPWVLSGLLCLLIVYITDNVSDSVFSVILHPQFNAVNIINLNQITLYYLFESSPIPGSKMS